MGSADRVTMARAAVLALLLGAASPASDAAAQTILCYEAARDVVTRTLSGDCKGEIIDEERAAELRRRRAERIRGAIKPPTSLFPDLKVSGMGTGFFVHPSGALLTNNHVVANCTGLSVDPATGEDAIATVVGAEPGLDLALLKVQTGSVAVARFRPGTLMKAGDPLVVVGYPNRGVSRVQPIATTGEFGGYGARTGTVPSFALQGEIRRGNSGGPVFDASGLVAGVVFAKRDTVQASKAIGAPADEFGFAIPAGEAIIYIKRLGFEPTFGFPGGASMTSDRIFAEARSFVARVNCWR